MLLKQIQIDGFRCLLNSTIDFDDKITLIVGENDSGKSSLIDCLNLFIGGYSLELDDFNYEKERIKISLVTDEFEFIREYKKEEFPRESFTVKPTNKFLESKKIYLSGLKDLIPEEDQAKIKELARIFGFAVRSNSRIDNLKEQLISKLKERDITINGGIFPELNKIQLDGKHFENIELFFREVFLKDKQVEIWNTKVKDNKTIKDIIHDELNAYSDSISKDLDEKGIKDKLKRYLKKLTEIKVEPSFEPRSLNISSKVKFLEGGKEIPVDKKGDGTKRRISLALLEYKVESEKTCDDSKLYVLDEPDTHLHVKAQLELFSILKELSEKGCQVILTTHSPFLINAIKPKQIRLLYQSDSNITKIKYLKDDSETSDKILRQLGIENIYLYFAKKIVLVEGETEGTFLPKIYEKINNVTLNGDLIKIINTRGIKNIPGFAKALLELVNKDSIYLLKDNDGNEDTLQLIEKLGISEDRLFTVGYKEFEDAFTDDVLFNVWKKYLEDCGKDICRTRWTQENISETRAKCASDSEKFSSELKSLNEGSSKKFSKVIFGEVLGMYCNESDIPPKIKELLDKLKNS